MRRDHLYLRMLAGALTALALVMAGCSGNGVNGHGAEEAGEYRSDTEVQLDELIERGVQEHLPPPPSDEELEIYAMRLEREKYAKAMRERTDVMLTPLAVAATFFVADGPVDFLLDVVPLGKLGDVYHVAKRGLALRKKSAQADELVDLMRDIGKGLDKDSDLILRLAMKIQVPEKLRALATIHERTRSDAVLKKLMEKEIKGQANVEWIADMLTRKRVDGAFARRFTFDTDLIEEFTLHNSNPSWKTLEDLVNKKPVSADDRGALALKVTGLLGENAAARLVKQKAFVMKYLGRADGSFDLRRGIGYGKNRSLDIAAMGDKGELVVMEIKNWSRESWGVQAWRDEIVAQLRHHDQGAEYIRSSMFPERTLTAKVLVIAKEGFDKGMKPQERRNFIAEVEGLKWTIEYIPSRQIGNFRSFLDDLR